mgnify:CR=1 FL=1
MGTKDGGKKPNPNDLNSFKGFFYYMIIILVMTVLLNGLVFVRTEKPGKGSWLQRVPDHGGQRTGRTGGKR